MARKDQADRGGAPINLVRRGVRIAVATCAVVAAAPAFGLSLLDIEIKSHLGQRLIAEIPFVLAPGERLDRQCLRQVRSGASGLPEVQGLQFSIDHVRRVIRAGSVRSLREPLSSMTVRVSCPGLPNMVREYSIWLDLPGGSMAIPAPTTPASIAVPLPATPRASVPAPEVPKAPVRPRAAAVQSRTIEAGASYRVQVGDTLSGIAFRVKQREPNTTWVWAQGIHTSNPSAFIGGDADKLKAGSLLLIPKADSLITQPTATAAIAPPPVNVPAAAQPLGRQPASETPAADIEAAAPISVATADEAAEARRLSAEQARAKLAEIERKLAALERTVELEPQTAGIEAAPEVSSEAPIYADEIPPSEVLADPPALETAVAVSSVQTASAEQPGGSSAWITVLAVLAGGALAVLFFVGLWRREPRQPSLADILDSAPEAKDVRVDPPQFDAPPEEIQWSGRPRVDPSDSMSVAEITLPRGNKVVPEPEPAPEPESPPTAETSEDQDFDAMPISAGELERILGKEEDGDDNADETVEETASLSSEAASLDDTSRMAIDETMANDETTEMEADGEIEGEDDAEVVRTEEMALDADLLEQSYIEEFDATEEFKTEFEKLRQADQESQDAGDTRRNQKRAGKKKKRA